MDLQNKNITLPIIPGRGLVTALSTNLRLEYLEKNNLNVKELQNSNLNLKTIQNNIESYIGSIEIPVGIVGPLQFTENNNQELVYTVAGTLEGALVASMNRGAKAISQSGGFTAQVRWQKMTRAPLFLFDKKEKAIALEEYINKNFDKIKAKAESYSNHAKLTQIQSIHIDNSVHTKFTYVTGDASGQNMTTTCTWHAMLYIAENFQKETGITILDYVLEGNGSSDKKVSSYATREGRGINVEAQCFLPEHILLQTLRTSAVKMKQAYDSSIQLAKLDGMMGYNINVANAIAAIFLATGQDLASIHESSIGILTLELKPEGLAVKLNLPNLVIGTVGGGTHLPKQSEALELMNCKGAGKVERFAKLIAGFALGLELSTFASIVSGEFAKAHEKLGRNKPVDWLLKNELNSSFLLNCLTEQKEKIESIEIINNDLLENGILTHIASRTTKKIIGFENVLIRKQVNDKIEEYPVLLKSKATDEEVIKGLHLLAASIDPELSNLINKNKENLEYKNCHLKELEIYEFLQKNSFAETPYFWGKHINSEREIYLLLIDFIDSSKMLLMNSENNPEQWNSSLIKKCIQTAINFHQLFESTKENESILNNCKREFKPWKSNKLYNKIIELLIREETDLEKLEDLKSLIDSSLLLEKLSQEINVPKTIIHNDFNSRNVVIDLSEKIMVYDWELALLNYPHRDIVELLTFTLNEDFTENELNNYLEYHYSCTNTHHDKTDWYKAYYYSTLELIITRLIFYEVAGIVVKYDFSDRVLKTALRMLKILRQYA